MEVAPSSFNEGELPDRGTRQGGASSIQSQGVKEMGPESVGTVSGRSTLLVDKHKAYIKSLDNVSSRIQVWKVCGRCGCFIWRHSITSSLCGDSCALWIPGPEINSFGDSMSQKSFKSCC
jgi:hypothetical protein